MFAPKAFNRKGRVTTLNLSFKINKTQHFFIFLLQFKYIDLLHAYLQKPMIKI